MRRKDKHLQFAKKNLELLFKKATEGFRDEGRGVLVARKNPGSSDIDTGYIFSDKILQALEPASKTPAARKSFEALKEALEVYNPEGQFVLILHMKGKAKTLLMDKAKISFGKASGSSGELGS